MTSKTRRPGLHRRVLGDRRGGPAAQGRERGRDRAPDGERREIKVCSGSATTPSSRCLTRPDQPCYDTLEFHVQLDFFLSETAARADVVLPARSGPRTGHNDERRGPGGPQAHGRRASRGGAARLVDRLRDRPPTGHRRKVRVTRRPTTSSRSCEGHPRAGTPTTAGSPTSGSSSEGAIFMAVSIRGPPGNASPVRGAILRARRTGALQRRRVAAPARAGRRRVPAAAHHRPNRRALPLGKPDPPDSALVEQTPRPWVEVHPSLAFANGDPVRVVTRRGEATYPALVTEAIRPDTVFVPYHWAGAASVNLLTVDALHPLSKIPEYKVCACRIERGETVTPAPPPPPAPGQTVDPTAARAAADHRPPSVPQGRGTGQG